MSGETKADVSGWTVDQLKEHMDRIFADLEKQTTLLNENFVRTAAVISTDLQRLYDTKIEAVIQEMRTQFKGSQIAIDKAETANEKRFASMNEFRGQLKDQASTFLPREEYTARHVDLENRITRLEKYENESSGKSKITAPIWGIAGAILTALIVAAILAFTGKNTDRIRELEEQNRQQQQRIDANSKTR